MLTAAALRRSKQGSTEHLVTVRPQVLSHAEHAVGNLFQRIHHIVRVARDGLGQQGERLSAALGELQEVLELVFDYVTPVDVDLGPVACKRVAESLAAHLRAHAAEVTVAAGPPAEVLADLRLLSRCFQLITKAYAGGLRGAAPVAVSARCDDGQDRAEFAVSASGFSETTPKDENGLAWQVAERLIELQGGEMVETQAAGQLTCRVMLPLAPRQP